MAVINLAAGARSAHAVLAAGIEDTVNFSQDWETVEVTNRSGADAIYFTVDASVAAVGGANTYVVPAVAGARCRVAVPTGSNTVVRLISQLGSAYSVTRIGD